MNNTLLTPAPARVRAATPARWARRGLLLLALAAAALLVLVFMLGSVEFVPPVHVQVDGNDVFSSFTLGETALEKLVFAALILAAVLAALLVIPAVLLLALFALVLLALLVVGLPMFVVLVVAVLLMSPLLLVGWLVWRAIAS